MNIQNLVEEIKTAVKSHRLETEGEYCRYLWQNEEGNRKMGLNEYGCADAVNILYTVNDFPSTEESRRAHIRAIQNMQDEKTGLFFEGTHHHIHTTAHCTAALELFDAKPLYKFKGLEEFKTPEGVTKLLEGLDWTNPWPQSHQGAGIYAALKLNGEIDKKWEKTYFKWLWDNADPDMGFWKKGFAGRDDVLTRDCMGGGFHYFFNLEYAKQPVRYPERIIDTCLDLYYSNNISDNFGQYIGFLEIDWVYSLTRAFRRTGYRKEDCFKVLRKFAKEYIEWLNSLDYKTHDGFNDLHMLFGTCCALAELQTALPGEIETEKSLRLVLDRRPFI